MASRYRWENGRYRDLRSGRFLSSQQVRLAIDQTLRVDQIRAGTLADDLRAGRISMDRWELEMRAMIREVNLYSAAAARGGFANMDAQGWGQVGGVVAEQDRFFAKFAEDVRSGKQPLNGKLTQRAAMYVEFGRNTHERANRDVQRDRGATEERNVTRDAEHCLECPELERQGWVPLGTLPLPGDRACHTNCRCLVETR